MPYFPKEESNEVTLTLANGDTVTLIEKELSHGDRKAMLKRFLSLQYQFKFKQRQADDIDRQIESAGLDEQAYEAAAARAVDLMAETSVFEIYGTVLPMRFASWDVYASRADLEAGKPIAMEREAIVTFAEAKAQNGALLTEIMDLLGKYDQGEQKNVAGALADGGNISTVTPASA